MTIKLYQPHYHNGESWEDSHDWKSGTVYLTEEDAIAEIMSKGLSDLGVKKVFTSKTLYTADNTGKEYGQEDLRNAWVDELTLGGDTSGITLHG